MQLAAEGPEDGDAARLDGFRRALDALREGVERELGDADAEHIRRVGRLSAKLEWVGRGLIHFSFEPLGFGLGVASLWAHKSLELMEIGHMSLNGCFDRLEGTERYH